MNSTHNGFTKILSVTAIVSIHHLLSFFKIKLHSCTLIFTTYHSWLLALHLKICRCTLHVAFQERRWFTPLTSSRLVCRCRKMWQVVRHFSVSSLMVLNPLTALCAGCILLHIPGPIPESIMRECIHECAYVLISFSLS